MRFMTVTLNAAIDTTYVMESFAHGKINRVARKLAVPGGKGNNVAKVLSILGHSVIATGFIAGHSGQFIEQGLRSMGVETAFMRIPGESRVCLSMIEADSGTITELLEPGVEIPEGDAEAFLKKASALVKDVDAVIVSGSLPTGLPRDYYARLLCTLRPYAARLVFDSSGEALQLGLRARPDLIKPNAAEMATLMGTESDLRRMIEFAQQQLLGPVLAPEAKVLLSLGERGATLITRTSVLTASPPRVSVVNPVGSGDAMLAGFLAASYATNDDSAALIDAVAVGTASTLHEVPGRVADENVAHLRGRVQLGYL